MSMLPPPSRSEAEPIAALLDDIDRWQYRVVNLGTFEAASRLGMTLSLFGSTGWELVTIYDKASNWMQGMEKGFMLFKRPVPPGDDPVGPWTEVWTAAQVAAAFQARNAAASD